MTPELQEEDKEPRMTRMKKEIITKENDGARMTKSETTPKFGIRKSSAEVISSFGFRHSFVTQRQSGSDHSSFVI
jgi:hypothetical protein